MNRLFGAWCLLAIVGCQAPAVRGPGAGSGGATVEPERADGSVEPIRPDALSISLPEVPPLAPEAASSAACGQLTAIVRDFRGDHPDFENPALNVARLFPGLVRSELGPDRKPVYAHPGATATTSGPAAFAQWYRDVPGTNLSFEVSLSLAEQRPGIFVYDNQAFFPIDGRGWPNDQRHGHNFHFTTELHTNFRYRGGERFTFTGDDDVFVFINGRLALDLGGLHPTSSQTVDLDGQAGTLGLAVGGSYPLDVFHAERHTVASTFRIETSIECLRGTVE